MSYIYRKQTWSTLNPWVTTDVPTMTATTKRWGIQNSCHVKESWSTSRKDSTKRWFGLTRTSKQYQYRWLWMVNLSLSFLSPSQATSTSPPEICQTCSETLQDKYLSRVISMDTTLCAAVMVLIPGVKSLRDSLINTIRVFSMTEPTPTSSPTYEQTNVSDETHHLHTKTCSEKCVGGPARYPW